MEYEFSVVIWNCSQRNKPCFSLKHLKSDTNTQTVELYQQTLKHEFSLGAASVFDSF